MSAILSREELDHDLYLQYCKIYMIERITEYIQTLPSLITPINYNDINRLIESLGLLMYDKITTEEGKIIILNKVYQIFKRVDIEISREYLYECIDHLSEYSKLVNKYYEDMEI